MTIRRRRELLLHKCSGIIAATIEYSYTALVTSRGSSPPSYSAMNDPVSEIETAINHCAAATSADAQILAFSRYFLPDASFLHPFCYVGHGPDSRFRIVQVYMFYRAVIPRTSFQIQSVAFDARNLHLYVRLIQRPEIWGLSRFVVPDLPMLIHFTLREVEGKYLIAEQEDNIQPRVC